MTSPWSYQDLRIDGTSIKGYGWGAQLGEGIAVAPSARGQDETIGYGRGDRWRPKELAALQRTFTMWVDSCDPATGLYATNPAPYSTLTERRLAQLNDNITTLGRLLVNDGAQHTMERDVLTGTGLQTWSSKFEVDAAARFIYDDAWNDFVSVSADLIFTDPLWRGPSQTASVGYGATVAVTNPGDVQARGASIRFVGPLTNPVLWNDTIAGYGNCWLKLGLAISAGDEVDVDVSGPLVTRLSDGANLIGSATNSGSRDWMPLARGVNSMRLDGASGSGQAIITFYPPRI